MDKREQLAAQWVNLSVAGREELFRSWIMADTALHPSPLELSTTVDEWIFGVSTHFRHWWVAVSESAFGELAPDRAITIGDAIVEFSKWVAFQGDIDAELPDAELENETADGYAAALLPVIIDGLEQERDELESMALDDDISEDELGDLEEQIGQIEDALKERMKELEDLGISD